LLQEEEIQKAIFVGNYDGAVDTCLKAGRLADALLIANIGGAELFKKTMQRYMRRNPRPYMAVRMRARGGNVLMLLLTPDHVQLACLSTKDRSKSLCCSEHCLQPSKSAVHQHSRLLMCILPACLCWYLKWAAAWSSTHTSAAVLGHAVCSTPALLCGSFHAGYLGYG
jgi:hypothetical protein